MDNKEPCATAHAFYDVRDVPPYVDPRGNNVSLADYLTACRKKALTGHNDPLTFQLLNTDYCMKTSALIMNGRTQAGKRVALRLRMKTYKPFFYLQRQRPFRDDEEVSHYLGFLERAYLAHKVTEEQKKQTPQQQQQNGRGHRFEPEDIILGWAHATNLHKTCYGWTPPDERLVGLIKVWVAKPWQSKRLHEFLEHDSFLQHCAPGDFVRTFEGGLVSYPQRHRLEHGLEVGGWVQTTVQTPLYGEDRFAYADINAEVDYDAVCLVPDVSQGAPLVQMSYDIECAGAIVDAATKTTRFPIPYSDTGRRSSVDPVTVICYVTRRWGVHRNDNEFDRRVALVYTPRGHPAIDISDTAQNPNSPYYNVELHCFATEYQLLRAFEEAIHDVAPDVLMDWNGEGFDLPYMFQRMEWLARFGNNMERLALKKQPYNLGLYRNGRSRSWVQRNLRLGRDETKVSTEGLTHMDGLVVWQHQTFGVREEGTYKLDAVAAAHLVYPNTSHLDPEGKGRGFPRRKLDTDVTHGVYYWQAGGKTLWHFVLYCMIDAELPALLLENHGKIPQMIEVARMTNTECQTIFPQKIQIKIVSQIVKHLWTRPEHLHLVPDYGTRFFHWPCIFDAERDDPAGAYHDPRQIVADTEDLQRRLHSQLSNNNESDSQLSGNNASDDMNNEYMTSPPQNPKQSTTEKAINYEGGIVLRPVRGLCDDLLLTLDFQSLYPKIIETWGFCYLTFLTSQTIARHKIPLYKIVSVVLGTHQKNLAGEHVFAPLDAHFEDYHTPHLVKAYWYYQPTSMLRTIIGEIFGARLHAKRQMAREHRTATLYRLRNFAAEHASAFPASASKAISTFITLCTTLGEAGTNSPEACMFSQTAVDAQAARAAGVDAWQAWVQHQSTLEHLSQADIAELDRSAALWNGKQLALKVDVNSVYGVSGASSGLLPLFELAASTTAVGRSMLKCTARLSESVRIWDVIDSAKRNLERFAVDHSDRESAFADIKNSRNYNTWCATLAPAGTYNTTAASEHVAFGDQCTQAREDDRKWRCLRAGLLSRGLKRSRDEMHDGNTRAHSRPKNYANLLDATAHIPVAHFATYRQPDRTRVMGGDTDSVFAALNDELIPNPTQAKQAERVGTYIAALINKRMPRQWNAAKHCMVPDTMCLENETTGLKRAIYKRKQYAERCIQSKNISQKGTTVKKRDSLPWVRSILQRATEIVLQPNRNGLTSLACIDLAMEYIQKELERFWRGEVGADSFILSTRLGKEYYENSCAQDAVAKQKRARGETVPVGTVLTYVMVQRPGLTPDQQQALKNWEVMEDFEYATRNNIPLDLERYFKKKVKKPIARFFAPLLANNCHFFPLDADWMPDGTEGGRQEEFEPWDETDKGDPVYSIITGQRLKKDESEWPLTKKLVKKRQNKFARDQEKAVSSMLFAGIETRFDTRKAIALRDHQLQRNRGYFQAISLTQECRACQLFFKGPPKSIICPQCKHKRRGHILLQEELDGYERTVTEQLVYCGHCVRLAGIPGADPADCTKVSCAVYKRLQNARTGKTRTNVRLADLRAALDW